MYHLAFQELQSLRDRPVIGISLGYVPEPSSEMGSHKADRGIV
jgi:hypothetical protein